jgi:hypothetical protein
MATLTSYVFQIENREPDWKGALTRRFRWSKLRFQWGRYCYITYPIKQYSDYVWWEWEEEKQNGNR